MMGTVRSDRFMMIITLRVTHSVFFFFGGTTGYLSAADVHRQWIIALRRGTGRAGRPVAVGSNFVADVDPALPRSRRSARPEFRPSLLRHVPVRIFF